MSEHHALSPSKLDIWAQCPCYEAGEVGEAAEAGSQQHEVAASLLSMGVIAKHLSEEDRANVLWYVDYVRDTKSEAYPLHVEQRLELLDTDFQIITFGTADAICGPDLFDYKSSRNEGEYTRQMAAYALALMRRDGLEQVIAHICYGKLRRVVRKVFHVEAAEALVMDAIRARQAADRKPRLCDYCGWCRNIKNCPAMTQQAVAVANGYNPEESTMLALADWHASKVDDPVTLEKGLVIAKAVKKWADSWIHHCTDKAVKDGLVFQDFFLKETKGKRKITDVLRAYELAGIPQAAFLGACEVHLSELVERYAAHVQAPSLAAAKRELEKRLSEVIERGKPSQSLVNKKED